MKFKYEIITYVYIECIFNCFATSCIKDSILYPVFAPFKKYSNQFCISWFEAVILKVALNSICMHLQQTNYQLWNTSISCITSKLE
jgi:hypothetical protein